MHAIKTSLFLVLYLYHRKLFKNRAFIKNTDPTAFHEKLRDYFSGTDGPVLKNVGERGITRLDNPDQRQFFSFYGVVGYGDFGDNSGFDFLRFAGGGRAGRTGGVFPDVWVFGFGRVELEYPHSRLAF
jgi:hypothetical protein